MINRDVVLGIIDAKIQQIQDELDKIPDYVDVRDGEVSTLIGAELALKDIRQKIMELAQ